MYVCMHVCMYLVCVNVCTYVFMRSLGCWFGWARRGVIRSQDIQELTPVQYIRIAVLFKKGIQTIYKIHEIIRYRQIAKDFFS